jgi:hypothetical protein
MTEPGALLDVTVRMLPLDTSKLAAERAEFVRLALQSLRQAVMEQDLGVAFTALRMLDTCSELEIEFSLEERAELVNLSLSIGLGLRSASWVNVACSTRALKCAGALLAPRLPGLVGKVNVSFEALYDVYLHAHAPQLEMPIRRRDAAESVHRHHGEMLFHLAHNARYYWPPGTAEKVCARFLPGILQSAPSDVRMLEDQMFLALFYPGHGNDDAALRLDAFVQAWGRVDMFADWDTNWFVLLKRLAKHKPTEVSAVVGEGGLTPARGQAFEPHLSMLFGRVHSSLRVSAPGASAPSERRSVGRLPQLMNHRRLQEASAKLVVQILGVGNCMDRLESLLASVRTHLHPSNASQQTERIMTFITTMCEAFAVRLGRQPECLPRAVKRRFVELVLPLLEQAVLGKSLVVINAAQACIRHLVCVPAWGRRAVR